MGRLTGQPWRMRPGIVIAAAALAVAVLAAGVWAFSPDGSADGRADDEGGPGPVITADEPWNGYPGAQVDGLLVLRDDCLLLGDDIVFWPYGTTWDATAQAVVFVGHPPAPVGEVFKGGGGEYGPEVDFESLVGTEAGDAIRSCLRKTDSPGVLVATP
jgi:hypothetical protein